MLSEDRINFFQIVSGRRPSWDSKVWYIAYIKIIIFHHILGELPHYINIFVKGIYEMFFIIYVPKLAEKSKACKRV